ncbi:hypothetical protein HWD03_gp048 [Alteromonas phage vB_AmeM_PT11-V22]|uniref:Uncharacterized protein n=1 Tax=Alteromonas phage vB_AmeM_PT11-V22 TaxID=2704031 RepID=A0A6C0R0V0_9CAUD|nr:hypothetical protein HWD03_gp048 [Alteromonas phage vB_AmeM_PT11-V22]QHZ59808.1 hypothetical protein [Alteromonas phage vB_AmeM_PT11-V22]
MIVRVNLEGDPIEEEVEEIVVDDNITLEFVNGEGGKLLAVDILTEVLDIHEVNRLIKGLELAKKLFLEVEEEKE